MTVMRQYMVSVKNVPGILKAIREGQAPERFTTRHLATLGFKNPADRVIISVLKGLGFLTEAGAPTSRYVQYLDEAQSGVVLREAIEEAYSDLFKIRRDAQNYSLPEVRNKIKTLTEGKLSDSVLQKMGQTFLALCKEADFAAPLLIRKPEAEEPAVEEERPEILTGERIAEEPAVGRLPGLVYNIQVILPTTKDRAVYDAIFRSLKEHLLR